jgi:hypothetical protein
MFEVTVWPDGIAPARRYVTRSSAEVAKTATGLGPLMLETHDVDRPTGANPGTSFGVLWLYLNGGGMAWIRLDLHREHIARDPARAGLVGEVGGFPDGTGGWFAVPASGAITAHQARQALVCWLEGGSCWPELEWD